MTLDNFPGLGLHPDKSVDWYYERLRSAPAVNAMSPSWHSDHATWPRWSIEEANAITAEVVIVRLLTRTADASAPNVGELAKRAPRAGRGRADEGGPRGRLAARPPSLQPTKTERSPSRSSAKVKLAAIPKEKGPYRTGSAAGINDLAAFVTALSRTVGHYRGEGECFASAR